MASESIDPSFFPTPKHFRAWLRRHHQKAEFLWVGYYKKATGKPSVTWEETVDEALCYGWIDGIRKQLNDEAYVIRFTPRKPQSVWSSRNIERVRALQAAGKMTKAGLAAFTHHQRHHQSGYVIAELPTELPEPMAAQIRKSPKAWAFYQAQPPGYRKQVSFWITSAKREDTRRRRLETLIEDSKNGLRIKHLRRQI